MTYNKLLLIIPLILSSFNLYSQELLIESSSEINIGTSSFNIDKESTKTYLIHLKRMETAYLLALNRLLNIYKKNLRYDPSTINTDLKAQAKKHKKALESSLRQGKNNISAQNNAFGEYNKFLVLSIHNVAVKDILINFEDFEKEKQEIFTKHKNSLSTNPLSYLFNPNESFMHKRNSIYTQTNNMISTFKKICETFYTERRQNEVMKGEYNGIKGRIHKIKDQINSKLNT
jgi:hypothetical protein